LNALAKIPAKFAKKLKKFQKNEKNVVQTVVNEKTSLDVARKNRYSPFVASLILRLIAILTP